MSRADAAAKKLAECMDYPWDYMPEEGRRKMREQAALILAAGVVPTKLPIPPAPVEPLSVVYVEGWNAAVDEFFGGAPALEPLVITVTRQAVQDAVALLRTPGHDVSQVISLLTAQPDGVWQSHGASDTMRHPEISDLVGGETDCLPVHHLQHDRYTDADADRPDVICDSNGQVVLDLCKRCGKGEAELLDNLCITHVNQGSKS